MKEEILSLKELLLFLGRKKLFIGINTLIVTILAIIYSFFVTPIYEGKAIVKIGEYKDAEKNEKVLLEDASRLSAELKVLFIDIPNNIKDKEARITSISTLKKLTNFISIRAEAINNDKVKKEIEKVVKHIQLKHQKILDDLNEQRKLEIANIDLNIKNIKEVELKYYYEAIKSKELLLSSYTNELKTITNVIQRIERKDASLTALKLMEKSKLLDFISGLESELFYKKEQFNKLQTQVLTNLEEKKKVLSSLMLTHNYKNSNIVGQIITSESPIKPQKVLIILVAFLTGLILSVFLVFLLDFIKSLKK